MFKTKCCFLWKNKFLCFQEASSLLKIGPTSRAHLDHPATAAEPGSDKKWCLSEEVWTWNPPWKMWMRLSVRITRCISILMDHLGVGEYVASNKTIDLHPSNLSMGKGQRIRRRLSSKSRFKGCGLNMASREIRKLKGGLVRWENLPAMFDCWRVVASIYSVISQMTKVGRKFPWSQSLCGIHNH